MSTEDKFANYAKSPRISKDQCKGLTKQLGNRMVKEYHC